ncbi:MAG: cytochrome d ubiquinol oxidase subunit II [Proteobacteria bacterium]|nr:cytochrome d ubiquinol oxidase subunit II [Pseudomonadota bacterium]
MDLAVIWFFLWALLWAIFFATDGFDLGVGMLLPFLGREDRDRRVMIASMGPLWDGNEVWLIAAGGITFAAFPRAYAVLFSSLYLPLLLVLFGLILRGVSMEFRGKHESAAWTGIWDGCLFVGSLMPAFLLGVAFSNIFMGLPLDEAGRFTGSLWALVNPYAVLGGMFFVVLFCLHGALWLAARTLSPLHEKAREAAGFLWALALILGLSFVTASGIATDLLVNYANKPVLFLIPLLFVVALVMVRLFARKERLWASWGASAVAIISATFFGMVGLFPRMLPSGLDPAFDLTLHNSSASPYTLKIMLVVALIFVPLVIAYQTWAYRMFSHKITDEDLEY